MPCQPIVFRMKWLWSQANIKEADKDDQLVHDHAQSFWVTKTFLLASSSARSKQLCFVHDQGQKIEQKHTTKKFVGIHNHS